jgi:hypothetical protein
VSDTFAKATVSKESTLCPDGAKQRRERNFCHLSAAVALAKAAFSRRSFFSIQQNNRGTLAKAAFQPPKPFENRVIMKDHLAKAARYKRH